MIGRRTAAGLLAAGLFAAVSTACAVPVPPPSAQRLDVTRSGAQAEAALATLRQVDDHPLFEMTDRGPAPRLVPGSPAATPPAGRSGYACTVFYAGGLMGRNFDWDHSPALVLRSYPTDGYASISLVDLSYLGIRSASDVSDPARRPELLRAAALPFDGVNEHGLAVGMAADEAGRTEVRPGRPVVGSLAVIRLALDKARTVAEAVAIFESYTVDFSGGPPLHYLIADAAGSAVVVEYVDGDLKVLPREKPWHLMTNFPLAVTDDEGRQADRRYRTGSAALEAAGGRLDEAAALALLSRVRQGHTQWSLVYDLAAVSAAVVTGQKYDRVHRLAL